MPTSIARTPATDGAERPTVGAGSGTSTRRTRPYAAPVHAEPVRRRRLVRRLRSARRSRLVLISAPAGYGKTSLLRQWAEADPRPFAWVSLDRSHRDPEVLVADVLAAMAGIGGLPPFAEPGARDPVRALRAALPAARGPFVLVLDGVHVAATPATLEVLSALQASVPPNGQLALATRSDPEMPLGRLAANGDLLRLGMRDLALDDAEAAALIRSAGVTAEAQDVAAVVHRVEGWPAAVSLAALACQEEGGAGAIAGFSGADRLAARYVRDELLGGLSDDAVSFLTRTSVLERMCGGLCDAVLPCQGSGRMLRELEHENRFVVALDRTEEWYRYHRVVRETLRSELRRREPGLERALHRRASAWLEDHGDREEAIAQARAGGDLARVGTLIWERLAEDHGTGRLATVRGWLGELDHREIAASAHLALAAAWCDVEEGGDLVEHLIAAAERAPDPPGPGGARSVAAGIATLRGGMASHGVHGMGEYAAAAGRLEPASHWRAFSCLFEGVACQLQGDRARARQLIEESCLRAGYLLPSVHALGLARLALLEIDDGNEDTAATLAGRAGAIVADQGLDDYLSMATVSAASALVHAIADCADEARRDILAARRLLEQAHTTPAWLAVETRVVLARAAIRCGDLLGARALLHEAERRLPGVGRAPALAEALEAAGRACRRSDDPFAESADLTAAELRILRYMPTHLSFPQVASQLHVSRFTVKSQALSIYRKLRVSSRAGAVERARALGLLPG